MEDNRLDCDEICKCTHDVNNKCDGHCISSVENFEERIRLAQEHNK